MLEALRMFAAQCGGVETALISCGDTENGIGAILAVILNVMTIGVGALGIVGIVISGIQYMTSSGDPVLMTKAKKRLIEIVIGLLAYGLRWVFLEWLIPGGIL